MFTHEIQEDPLKLTPRWLRIPAACQYSGLSRAQLYLLLANNEIQSASVCKRGRTRGVRVVDKIAIDRFMERRLSAKEVD
jgi:predicted DNA-binding transcriptional regulator AlpA